MERGTNDALVNAPPHYRAGDTYETIRVIEAWQLPYHLGNVVKYVSRHERKGKPLEDLRKARWYLNRYIELLEAENEDSDRRRQHHMARRGEVRRGRTTPVW